jgi:hypothetical protein
LIYALAVLAGIIGAVVGWFVTGAVTVWIAGLCGMSDFEGYRGMFAFFAVGPVGGLASMVASAWLVLRAGQGRAPLAPALARLAIVLAGIVGVVGAGIWLRLATLDTYTNTAPPMLEFEIRVPTAMAVPEPSTIRVELHTDKNVGDSQLTDRWVQDESGHQVIAGTVPLALKTSSRLLVMILPDQPTRLFTLPLSREPASTALLGVWQRPNHIHAKGADQPQAAPADDPVELRYRVRYAGED